MEIVLIQIDIGHHSRAAVATGVTAGLRLHPARKNFVGNEGDRGVQTPDAKRGKANEFTVVTQTVLIDIAPDAQIAEAGILGINCCIAVAVQIGQRFKAVACLASATQGSVVAKQRGSICDRSIADTSPDQKTVATPHPARSSPNPVVIEIKQWTTQPIADYCFNFPIAIQVDRKRISFDGN
ncbi:MAG: hypothetical protein WC100_13520 [Sterolibacterium sp.]